MHRPFLNNPYVLQYSAGTAELTKVTTPAGGTLGWAYRTFAYSSGFSYREVTTRSMQQSPSALTNTWGIGLDNNTAGHASTTVTDNGAGTSKVWTFTTAAGPFLALVSAYQEKGASAATIEKDYTWTQDPAGRPYIGSVTTTMDPGQTYQAQTKTAQTLDLYGNISQTQIFDYGNLGTAARTYNYTYLTDWNFNQYYFTEYIPKYIRNRLTLATVTSSARHDHSRSKLLRFCLPWWGISTRADRSAGRVWLLLLWPRGLHIGGVPIPLPTHAR